MKLLDVADRLNALDHSAVKLDTERCLHSLYRFSSCEACFKVCPVSAIQPGKPPALDAEKCQACLACLTVCPVGAYAADDAVASLLNAATHLDGGRLELLCEKNPQAGLGISEADTGISVKGCLAGLGLGAYLALAALGLEHILVRTDACAACEWGMLAAQVETQVNQAKQLLEAWGKAETLACVSSLDSPVARPLWKATNPPISRRDLFRMAARQGQIAFARSIEDGQSPSGRRPGRDHLRTLGAVAHLPDLDFPENIMLGGMGFASLEVTAACTACGTCARVCPTNALEFNITEDKTAFTLKLYGGNCIGCEICVHVCAPSAVSVNHTPTFAQVFGTQALSLQAGGLVKCEQCGILMAAQPDVHLCQVCDYRRTHPFGSMQLPGLKDLRPPEVAKKLE